MYCIVLYFTKVIKGSTSMKDCTAKNGHVNASTMKDVVGACCNAKRENIDVNMKTTTTVGSIKEPTYPGAKDETVLFHVPVLFAGTSKSDKVIGTMVDTKATAIAATGVTDQHVNGAEVELQITIDCYPVTATEPGTAAAIDTAEMKGQGKMVV